jgi:hypothetical protein
MYLRVTVKHDGCIRLAGREDWASVIHRETRLPFYISADAEAFHTLAEAKQARTGDEAILQIDDEGAGVAVWVTPQNNIVTCARLAKWKGCYGAWNMKLLQEVAA